MDEQFGTSSHAKKNCGNCSVGGNVYLSEGFVQHFLSACKEILSGGFLKEGNGFGKWGFGKSLKICEGALERGMGVWKIWDGVKDWHAFC